MSETGCAMNAETLTRLRARANQGPDGDHVFVIACKLGHHGRPAQLAAQQAETEIHRAGPWWTHHDDTRIADRIIGLAGQADPSRDPTLAAGCACAHPPTRHRPSAVTPFGLGLCREPTCGCARYTPNSEVPAWPEPAYRPVPHARYALVVHRASPPRWEPSYAAPEHVDDLPTVSAHTYRQVGHRAVDYDPDDRVTGVYFYADWAGGPHHRTTADSVHIHRCGCDTEGFHGFGVLESPQLVAELAPLLEWTNRHTGLHDWCELVPIPPGARPVARNGINHRTAT